MEFLEEDVSFPYPRYDLDELTEAIEVIRESDIEQRIIGALEQSSALLPGPDMVVCLLVHDHPFTREHFSGVTGGVTGPQSITLLLFPEEGWLDWIPYWVAAFHYVAVWLSHPGVPEEQATLLDAMVHTGRVHSFATLVYPEMASPQIRALTPEQEAEQWQRMQRVLDSTDIHVINEFMFEDFAGNVARWTGYTVGYTIVQAFLENNPEVSVEEWMTMDTREILERSGYSPGSQTSASP